VSTALMERPTLEHVSAPPRPKCVYGIVGSRGWPDLTIVERHIEELSADPHDGKGFALVSGGARGVDSTAEVTAMTLAIPVVSYRPFETDRGLFIIKRFVDGEDTGMFGGQVFSGFASAALFRNGLIVRDCTELHAFWDESSRGTKDTITKAREAGRRVRIITP